MEPKDIKAHEQNVQYKTIKHNKRHFLCDLIGDGKKKLYVQFIGIHPDWSFVSSLFTRRISLFDSCEFSEVIYLPLNRQITPNQASAHGMDSFSCLVFYNCVLYTDLM